CLAPRAPQLVLVLLVVRVHAHELLVDLLALRGRGGLLRLVEELLLVGRRRRRRGRGGRSAAIGCSRFSGRRRVVPTLLARLGATGGEDDDEQRRAGGAAELQLQVAIHGGLPSRMVTASIGGGVDATRP